MHDSEEALSLNKPSILAKTDFVPMSKYAMYPPKWQILSDGDQVKLLQSALCLKIQF